VTSLLARLDALPADRLRLVFGAVAALGAIAALVFFEPLGPPGDLSTKQPSHWDPEADDMKDGIDLELRDPEAALAIFRQVLQVMPKHYQATREMALTLDRIGRREEARPFWEDVVHIADYYAYKAAAAEGRKRLETRP
jgi:hypothetical protein